MKPRTQRKIHFTKEELLNLIPPESGSVDWWDDESPGLACRISSAGLLTFCWLGREGRKFRRVKIGNFPAVTVAAARIEAKKLALQAINGERVETKRGRLLSGWTLRQLFDWYYQSHSLPHKRTAEWDRRQFERVLKPWADRPVSDITKTEIRELHLSLATKDGRNSGGTYAANKMLELLGHMFRTGIENGHVNCADPTAGIKRFPRHQRERFLDAEELPRWLAAVETLRSATSRDFLKLALFTGARRGNVCAMRWSDLNLKAGVWVVPHEQSKNKKPMNIILSAPALAILVERQKTAINDWVLPGIGSTGHYNDPKDCMKRVCERAGIRNCRIHDLRRTLGSWMAPTTSLQVIGKQLGHSSLASTAIYARLELSAVREAVEAATKAMTEVMTEKPKKKRERRYRKSPLNSSSKAPD